MTTTWTQADITALEAKIKAARRRARFGDREVEYEPIGEMLKLLQTMKEAVAAASNATPTRTTYATVSKGRRRQLGG